MLSAGQAVPGVDRQAPGLRARSESRSLDGGPPSLRSSRTMSFQSWLQDLHTTFVARRRPTGRRKPSAARRPRFRPAMESLEAREVPAILNVPPSGLTLALSEPTIGENGTAVLSGSFSDPDVLDTHLLTIDW